MWSSESTKGLFKNFVVAEAKIIGALTTTTFFVTTSTCIGDWATHPLPEVPTSDMQHYFPSRTKRQTSNPLSMLISLVYLVA